MQAHSLMVIKKILVITLSFFGAIYFCYVLYAFFSAEVAGIRYISLFVSGGSPSWSSYYLFGRPYFKITDNNEAVWRVCEKLDKAILGYIENNSDWSETGPYEVVSESYPSGYVAYIKTKNRLLYIRGGPDFAGDPPSEEEKNICAR